MKMALDFPSIYLLSWNFAKEPGRLYELEKQIGAEKHLVFNLKEADVVIGKIYNKKRAWLELRKLGVETEDATKAKSDNDEAHAGGKTESPRKKQKFAKDHGDRKDVIVLGGSTESESEGHNLRKAKTPTRKGPSQGPSQGSSTQNTIKVLNCEWYIDSVKAGEVLPMAKYLVYEGRVTASTKQPKPHSRTTVLPSKEITSRAKSDTPPQTQKSFTSSKTGGSQGRTRNSQFQSHPAHLLHQSTTDHEMEIPPIPDFLHTKYSCQRPTPLHGPNDDFLVQLRIIKRGRLLEGDQIGVRAYSAAIATIAAYPYTLTSTGEIQGLPNLGAKFAKIWQLWKDTGSVPEVVKIQSNEEMKILNIFYEIFDVGEKNARAFMHKGWKDLDDVVQYGWDTLTRNQQIGVKFYDDFQTRIPRPEVEKIGNIVLDHANKIRDGFQMVICGGYRRGKPDSGDVDVVLSHPDEEATLKFLDNLAADLEDHEYVTHRLRNSMKNSERGQNTLKWRGTGPRKKGGFDTLDHCFCVWQDPDWPTKEKDLEENPDAKNPNPHRRVDIIISPWRTAGCAVIGWSGATMFERDLRAYCTATHGLKFDSSGVRRVADGTWVDLEGWEEGEPGDLLAKEKRVFKELGLEWREPTERCTD